MKSLNYLLLLILLCFVAWNCAPASQNADSETSISENVQKNPEEVLKGVCTNGVEYTIFTDKKGAVPKFKDFLTLNLSYSTITPKDSLIFSSFQREKPIQMRFNRSMFKGAINEGIVKMTEGDSAVFIIPSQLLYTKFPSFTKRGENLMYNVKLIKVVNNPHPIQ